MSVPISELGTNIEKEKQQGQVFILHRLLCSNITKLIDIIQQSFQQSLSPDELVKAALILPTRRSEYFTIDPTLHYYCIWKQEVVLKPSNTKRSF